MYYDRLKQRVHAVVKARQDAQAAHVDIVDCIAACYLPIHKEVQDGTHTIFHLPGGRGSAKSSFASLEIVDGIMKDPTANGIVFRKTAATMRESTFAQIAWAVDALGASGLWRGSVSPMQFVYLPTGQTVYFRGLDDASKIKSIRPRQGTFKYIWFEELSEMDGPNQVRNVLQWGKRFKRKGGIIEYEMDVMIDGHMIPESQVEDYNRRKHERAEQERREAAERLKNTPAPRTCPFNTGGMMRDCSRESCAVYVDGRCAIAGATATQATEGKSCPLASFKCHKTCALYQDGCTLTGIFKGIKPGKE